MKLIVLLISVVIVVTDQQNTCELIAVRGKDHKKEVLASGLDLPYQLSIYKDEHKIFFSYNYGEQNKDTFKIGYIEPGKNTVTEISEVENGFASAVDEANHRVYLGGSTGIFVYHPKKKDEAPHKIISRRNIWYMFFKSPLLYFIDYPSHKLYKYDTSQEEATAERQVHITEKIYQYVIDKDDDQFITSKQGLFRIKNDTAERINYVKDKRFRGVALNNNGEAYFCGDHSIYVANKQNHSLEEIANVRNVFGITFDKEDNLIYSDPDEIVKVLPDATKCLTIK